MVKVVTSDEKPNSTGLCLASVTISKHLPMAGGLNQSVQCIFLGFPPAMSLVDMIKLKNC